MTTKKMKLSDIAKDLKVPVKEVAEVLAGHFGTEQKKPSQTLNEQEMNVVFEHYTGSNQVSDFNGYFASKDTPKPEKKEAPKASAPAAKTKAAAKQAAKADETQAPAEPTAPAAAPAAKPQTEKAAETPAEKPAEAPAAEAPKEPAAPAVEPAAPKTAEPAAAEKAAETPKNTEEKVVDNVTDRNDTNKKTASSDTRRPANDRPANGGERRVGGNNGERRNGPAAGGDRNGSGERRYGDRNNGDRNNGSRNGNRDNRGGERRFGDRNNGNGGNRFQNNNNNRPKPAPAPAAPAAPAEPVEKERTVRHVDTKASDTNLDKYNEHYEDIAPTAAVRRNDSQQRKQKLNQKSKQQKKGKFGGPKRETEAEKLQRLALEKARKQQLKVMIPDEIVVSELASRLKVTVTEVIKKLMMMGVMAAQTEVIDFDTAALVAMELGAKVEKEVVVTIEEQLIHDETDAEEDLQPRCPVVVVMGHVDHGKTSILDKIRHSNVTAGEAGGITQAIGAYQVTVDGNPITFLDTPGHEAFTAMRQRGAMITDIAVLVVAADDGIMPQTVEAINHAKAANVQIIVAINKMDKPHADPERVKQELTEYGLVPEEWGGDVICVPVSALTGQGIDDLLENILLVAEVQELKANPNRLAKGAVVEARLDKGRGPVATLLVQNGTLHTGDIIIAGTSVGRVRQMLDDKGNIVTEAGPSVPVEITGMAEVPAAGDIFNAVENERLARELVEQRRQEQKEEQWGAAKKVTLENLFSQIAEGEMKELPIVVKADVQGSAEAVKQSLEKLSNEEVKVKVIHAGVGAVSKSDVMLANASGAIIIGFNVRPDPIAKAEAEANEVEMRMYRIIYDAIDDVKDAMKGMLAPKIREVELGRIEVRQVYKISNVGTVAGAYVLSGKVSRDAQIRVVRDGIVIAEDSIDSLKRFKNDVKEVAESYECGISLVKFSDIKEGDIFEAFKMEEYRED
jgi:translation initiation factor IF-2